MTREEAIEVLKKQIDKYTLIYAEGIAALKNVINDLELQPGEEQKFYVATRIPSDDELKHLEKQLKKERSQLVSEEQKPCEDAISRQAVHIELEKWITYGEYKYSNATKYLFDRIDRLPPVTPQQKTSQWINKIKVKEAYGIAGEKNLGSEMSM